MLAVEGVTHRYGRGDYVLKDVTFRYPRSGVLAFVGPSGSGKTTLLGIVGGILEPSDGGEVSFGDATLTEQPTWIFQNPMVLAHRSAVDNAALGAYASGVRWKEALEAAARALDTFGLGHVTETRAALLSGGEVQRLVLARAEVYHTSLLLADEPTAQLDRHNSSLIAAALRRVSEAGATVIVATHDPLIADTADAVVTIENGAGTYVDRS
jgi:ABC-type lipoprotein export system ATPase subunit